MKVAISQLTGRLSAEIRQFSGELVRLIAHMEALIDYPEEEIPELGLQHVRDVCLSQIHRLTDLINTAHEGRIMRGGA